MTQDEAERLFRQILLNLRPVPENVENGEHLFSSGKSWLSDLTFATRRKPCEN